MITEAQINELKAKHGNVLHELTIIIEGKKETYIIKTPTRSVIDAIASEGGNSNEVSKTLISNCVVYGNLDLVEQNGKVYTTLLSRIKDEIGTYESEVKKL